VARPQDNEKDAIDNVDSIGTVSLTTPAGAPLRGCKAATNWLDYFRYRHSDIGCKHAWVVLRRVMAVMPATGGLDGSGGTSPQMTLILRSMKKHMHWDDAKDDYAILDGDKTVGRIYREHGESRWLWSVNTSPFPAPPPNNGLASSLEEAKQQFKQRYEEMKTQGVRPFSDG
jgi:hypothetical protein